VAFTITIKKNQQETFNKMEKSLEKGKKGGLQTTRGIL